MDSRYTISILKESIKYTREFTDKIVETIDQSGDLYKKLTQEADMSIDNYEAAILVNNVVFRESRCGV